jgi:RNA polymerase sigma-70 factor (ECF subfamily)
MGETTQILGWVDRLRAGDDSAMDELLVHFETRLIHLTQKLLRTFPAVRRWEQTDDVFQGAAMRLRRALKGITPGSTREFFRLATLQIRRELLDLAAVYRHRSSPSELGQVGSGSGAMNRTAASEPVDDREGPDELEAWTDFHHAAATLPDEIREVFNLLWYGGLSQEEASSVLRVSVRTIKARWQQARLAIHRALGGRLPWT